MAGNTQIPLIPVRDLPLATEAPGSFTQLIAVLDNATTARVPWSLLSAQIIKLAEVPAEAVAEGTQGEIAVGDALYSYGEGVWGKTARYTAHWDDLDGSPRFVLTNKVMDLSDAERANLQANVGLTVATEYVDSTIPGTLGLIKGSSSVRIDGDGVATVPRATASIPGIVLFSGEGPDAAAASVEYVDTHIQAALRDNVPVLPVASSDMLGGIFSSETLSVDDNGKATVHVALPGGEKPGLVNIADADTFVLDGGSYDAAQMDYATPVELVIKLVDTKIQEAAKVATTESPGIVTPSGAIVIALGGENAGAIDVRPATKNQRGAVRLIDSVTATGVDETEGVAPSAKAVRDYVDSYAPDISIPVATSSAIGGIKLSDSVRINANQQAVVPLAKDTAYGIVRTVRGSEGDLDIATVPTEQHMQEYVNSHSAAAQPATQVTAGAVLVRTAASEDEEEDAPFAVPTYQCMIDYIDEKLSRLDK